MISPLRDFLRLESASGILLVMAAVLGLVMANSPLAALYERLQGTPLAIQIGQLIVAKPLLLWINDGLMAIFFLVVGLEIKREVLEGELARPAQVILPALGAIGGMAAPALIYVLINHGDPVAMRGWAIPTATDIAFALGILALLGKRVPNSLKLFLLTLAILDDLGAIVIIALFYSGDLSLGSLAMAGGCVAVLIALNLAGVTRLAAFVIVGVILWVSVLKSGVHATLAGVVLAFAIPLRTKSPEAPSLARDLEHDLHPWVAFGILPLFAFANAGLDLTGLTLDSLAAPVPLGIALGLFLGKPLGILLFTGVPILLRLVRLPGDLTMGHIAAVGVLCGVGFTMSLFIGSLAFEQGGPDYAVDDRLGILVGSLASALVGYGVARLLLGRAKVRGDA
jgi:NhaA family Na+:H+ antiporter